MFQLFFVLCFGLIISDSCTRHFVDSTRSSYRFIRARTTGFLISTSTNFTTAVWSWRNNSASALPVNEFNRPDGSLLTAIQNEKSNPYPIIRAPRQENVTRGIYSMCELEILFGDSFIRDVGSGITTVDAYQQVMHALNRANRVLGRPENIDGYSLRLVLGVKSIRSLNASETREKIRLSRPPQDIWPQCLTVVFVSEEDDDVADTMRSRVEHPGRMQSKLTKPTACATQWLGRPTDPGRINLVIVNKKTNYSEEPLRGREVSLSIVLLRAILYSFHVGMRSSGTGEYYLLDNEVFNFDDGDPEPVSLQMGPKMGLVRFLRDGGNEIRSCIRDTITQVYSSSSYGIWMCGNGIVERDEECDCGDVRSCSQVDPCCVFYTGDNNNGCTLESECSWRLHACCTSECRRLLPEYDHEFPCSANRSPVSETDQCKVFGFCDGEDATCPEKPRVGRVCNRGYALCSMQGTCNASLCAILGSRFQECTCDATSRFMDPGGGTLSSDCLTCCLNEDQECMWITQYAKWKELERESRNHIYQPYKNVMTPCWRTPESRSKGYCDGAGTCLEFATTMTTTESTSTVRTTTMSTFITTNATQVISTEDVEERVVTESAANFQGINDIVIVLVLFIVSLGLMIK